MDRVALALLWLVSRAALVLLLFHHESWIFGDVSYFADSMNNLGAVGLHQTLVEYPLPAVAVLAVPWLVAHALHAPSAYSGLLVAAAVATDAAFMVLLHRAAGRRVGAGPVLWLVGVPLLGATTYARFDILPGALVGAAVLFVPIRQRLAIVCASVATGIKLWPAMLLPPLFAASRRRAAPIALAGAIGVALSGASLLIAGWDRLVSPLTYQADRGLQVESVSATPAMIAWWLHPHRWHVVYAVHRAYEVTGPGVGALLFASAVLTALYAVGLLVGWWRVLTSPVPVNLEAVVWLSLASVTGFIVTGKVLSPQYLLWLLPAAAAGLVVCGWSRRLRAWCVVLLAAAGATQLVFPTYYLSVILPQPHTWLTIQILAGRNLLLVGLLVAAVLEFRRTLGVSEPPPASLGDADDAVVAGVGVDAPLGYRGPVLDEPVRRQDR